MLILAYLVSGTFCALEILGVSEGGKVDAENSEPCSAVKLKNAAKLLRLDPKRRLQIMNRIQDALDECLSDIQ